LWGNLFFCVGAGVGRISHSCTSIAVVCQVVPSNMLKPVLSPRTGPHASLTPSWLPQAPERVRKLAALGNKLWITRKVEPCADGESFRISARIHGPNAVVGR
jgi:hypothetical protein